MSVPIKQLRLCRATIPASGVRMKNLPSSASRQLSRLCQPEQGQTRALTSVGDSLLQTEEGLARWSAVQRVADLSRSSFFRVALLPLLLKTTPLTPRIYGVEPQTHPLLGKQQRGSNLRKPLA